MDSQFINQGVSVKPGLSGDLSHGRTLIVSGVGRGGTTMLAELLREAGIHMGDRLATLVSEDADMLYILRSADRGGLDRMIAGRNAQHRNWGFKVPNIHCFLRHSDINRFRNPHLVLVFRDPQAIAVRAELAEYADPLEALRGAGNALTGLIEFAARTPCPALLLSYEKALVFPGAFIAALLQFCGLSSTPALQARLHAQMQPNAPAYIKGARRSYVGWVDGMLDGVLCGWCCEQDSLAPVDLDLLVDGRRAASFRADVFRQDVLDAGIGNGLHGFAFPIDNVPPAARLEVVVAGTTFLLENSGRSVREYLDQAA